MRVYTRTGDKGKTGLASGERVPKYHPRIEAYGSVDELNSYIGLLNSEIRDQKIARILLKIQNRIFTISSHLAVDHVDMAKNLPSIIDNDIKELEDEMDSMLDNLPDLKNFILPGGHPLVSHCHIARTICRRVERIIVKLAEEVEIDINMVIYINRLSDYLFVLARKIGSDLGVDEITWTPDYKLRGY